MFHLRNSLLSNKFFFISIISFITLFILSFYPVWKNLIFSWYNNEDFSHGFAIIPLTSYIIWRKRYTFDLSGNKHAVTSLFGLVICIVSLLLYFLSFLGEVKTLSSISMLFFVAGSIIYTLGFSFFKSIIFPFALLFLMIPIPSQILALLTIPLQFIVTNIAGYISRSINIPLYIQGNLIHIPNHTFEVVQACSGLRSIMTLVTLGAYLGYFMLSSSFQRFLLILSSLPIAIATNALRIICIVALAYYFQLDLMHGPIHTLFGIIIFILSLCSFLLIQKGLSIWLTK